MPEKHTVPGNYASVSVECAQMDGLQFALFRRWRYFGGFRVLT